ncbi:MAG: hypothetical protein ACRCY4_02320 [Brevinema sp.]
MSQESLLKSSTGKTVLLILLCIFTSCTQAQSKDKSQQFLDTVKGKTFTMEYGTAIIEAKFNSTGLDAIFSAKGEMVSMFNDFFKTVQEAKDYKVVYEGLYKGVAMYKVESSGLREMIEELA